MAFKKTLDTSKLKLNRHFVFIEAPISIVGPSAIFWGEATWWPKRAGIKFIKTSPGELALGAMYKMRLSAPLPQTWTVEVTKFIPGYLVERTFRSGFFKGFEVTRAEERANGTRVEYELYYSIPNPVNNIFWSLFGQAIHDTNITKILTALKDYCLKHIESQEGSHHA